MPPPGCCTGSRSRVRSIISVVPAGQDILPLGWRCHAARWPTGSGSRPVAQRQPAAIESGLLQGGYVQADGPITSGQSRRKTHGGTTQGWLWAIRSSRRMSSPTGDCPHGMANDLVVGSYRACCSLRQLRRILYRAGATASCVFGLLSAPGDTSSRPPRNDHGPPGDPHDRATLQPGTAVGPSAGRRRAHRHLWQGSHQPGRCTG